MCKIDLAMTGGMLFVAKPWRMISDGGRRFPWKKACGRRLNGTRQNRCGWPKCEEARTAPIMRSTTKIETLRYVRWSLPVLQCPDGWTTPSRLRDDLMSHTDSDGY